MTRFYSEYEIKKIDKKLNEDIILNNDKNKEELKDALDQDNHRSNVDRAKKKAVTQYMDYDGFHQMVLGADLKGMKMSDVIEIKPDVKYHWNFLFQLRSLGQKTHQPRLEIATMEAFREGCFLQYLVNFIKLI